MNHLDHIRTTYHSLKQNVALLLSWSECLLESLQSCQSTFNALSNWRCSVMGRARLVIDPSVQLRRKLQREMPWFLSHTAPTKSRKLSSKFHGTNQTLKRTRLTEICRVETELHAENLATHIRWIKCNSQKFNWFGIEALTVAHKLGNESFNAKLTVQAQYLKAAQIEWQFWLWWSVFTRWNATDNDNNASRIRFQVNPRNYEVQQQEGDRIYWLLLNQMYAVIWNNEY